MCGRFALDLTPAQFQRHFGCPPPGGYRPRWNITPDSDIVVVRSGPAGREAVFARWGLLGPWMRDPRDPARMINARLETAARRPMFRRAFARGRVLVPATGFYEWQKQSRGPSRPFFIRLRTGAPMALAGIVQPIRLEGSELRLTVAILTREALAGLRPIHPRMPVLVPPAAFDRWLDPAPSDPADIAALLVPPAEEELMWEEVSRRVNDPREDDPGLIRPLILPPREPPQPRLF